MLQALRENIFCLVNVHFHEEPFLKTVYNSVVPGSNIPENISYSQCNLILGYGNCQETCH